MPELYRMLGALQQSVEDIRAMLTKRDKQHDDLEKRVGSLERSRVRAKAWMAGATAAISASLWVVWQAWEVAKELAKR